MAAGAVSAPLIIPIIYLQTHRAKNHIDTNTPVSIHSDTPGVLIFYSLDGSRPVAAAVQRGSAGSSRKYSEPILLPAGRVAVRAVAVTSDGRESSTVTKVFSVEFVDSYNRRENKENFRQNKQQCPSEGTSHSAENSAGSSLTPPEPRMMGNGTPQSGPHFLTSGLGSPSTAAQAGSSQCSQSATSGALKQLKSKHASRNNQQTDVMRCVQCLRFCPSDPFSRFCSECGASVPALPEQRLPPAEEGQVVFCVFCHSVVPVNCQTCLICEAAINQQQQDHVVCVCCGSGNPAHISSCLTCENRLQQAECVGNSAPSVPSAGSRPLCCSRCKRINHPDARFCDWCGSKPTHAASCVTCWRCGASGYPYAFYCATCGTFLEVLPTSSSDIIPPDGAAATNQSVRHQASAPTSRDTTWKATPTSDPAPRVKLTTSTVEQYTQTVGLYYPSATELQRKEQQKALQLNRQQASRDRQPLLTAISPGRGYWRKQLDHVCAHLRSYVQNNAPFRALLGEPRLGQMVSAVIQEDRYEVSLTVSFVSAGQEEKQVAPAGDGVELTAGRTETLSSVTERGGDSSGFRAAATFTTVKDGLCLTGSDPSSSVMSPPKPPVKDVQLLKELGPDRGRISIIQELLDQGADPCCYSSDGRHALVVAVVNGHHDVLPVLVQQGADVDQQSGQMKNSALHEAAALGSEGLQCAQVLLSCKASMSRRNAGGQTAYDVAVNSGCSDMVSLLAARTGMDLLSKLRNPKLNLDVF